MLPERKYCPSNYAGSLLWTFDGGSCLFSVTANPRDSILYFTLAVWDVMSATHQRSPSRAHSTSDSHNRTHAPNQMLNSG